MRRFGLIGYPLSHSFSAGYFASKFEKEGIADCRYDNYPIASISELPALFETDPSLEGINITIPYKEQVLAYLDEKNDIVASIAACNCIRRENGKLKGYNTDVIGFEESLKEKLASFHTQALVLGTGGAAKAVEYVLRKRGIACRSFQGQSVELLFPMQRLPLPCSIPTRSSSTQRHQACILMWTICRHCRITHLQQSTICSTWCTILRKLVSWPTVRSMAL